jgi:hypothetical protein
MAITFSELLTGDDWALQCTFTENGAPLDLSGAADISAAIIAQDGTTQIDATVQSPTAQGADWANGIVVVSFTAAQTAAMTTLGHHLLEVQVTDGGKYSFPRERIKVAAGVIA